MEDIISMQHSEPWRSSILMVDWNVGNWCNYSCSYCPKYLHDGSLQWHDVDKSVAFIKKLSTRLQENGRTAHFQWTGGEPTAYPELLRLAKVAQDSGNSLGLITNGSRGLSWWHNAGPIWNEITMTYHIGHVDEKRFFSLAEYLSSFAIVHVNVTAKPDEFTACEQAADKIAKEFPHISITLKPLLLNFKTELMNYTAEQIHTLQTKSFPNRKINTSKKVRGPMLLIAKDGSTTTAAASRLVANQSNSWLGWTCNIGLETLIIHGDGVIYRANCRQGGPIGSLSDPEVNLPNDSIKCSSNKCKCLLDIATSRILKNA